MFSKYLTGFIGVTTVAGGVTATTIALNKKGEDQINDKVKNAEESKGPKGSTKAGKGSSQSAEDEAEETEGDDKDNESFGVAVGGK